MPRFCECGADMFICQECGQDKCSQGCKNLNSNFKVSASERIEGKGNVCRACLSKLYYKDRYGKYVKTEPFKPMTGLKDNPAYDLMM